MARPLRIEISILGLSHAAIYTHRNRPARRCCTSTLNSQSYLSWARASFTDFRYVL